MAKSKYILTVFFLIITLPYSCHNDKQDDNLKYLFQNPPESAKPWVFWFWIKASTSKEGITADLEAMKDNGIGGACLIPIQGAEEAPLYEPIIEQLTPEWWDMVAFAFKEAKRLDLKLAMHSCDGFAVAGGPWITPEMSMQKLVWSKTTIQGNQNFKNALPQPETIRDYYNDIAVYAYPTQKGYEFSTNTIKPKVSSNLTNENLNYLTNADNTKEFKSKKEGWILYEFENNFTCRSITIKTNGLNYASNHLIIESSNDGVSFDSVCRLEPARHGWQDYEYDYEHSIPPTTAKFFRFTYSKEDVEPGSEDLEMTKWSPDLKIQGIFLSGEAKIHQYNSKNGLIWRIAKRTTPRQVPNNLFIPKDEIIDITAKLDINGVLNWEAPKGNWTILRIGHTSTGHTNYIGGKGLGLECDKFDPNIVAFQFDQWFGKAFEKVDSTLANEVLKVFLMDSWECGSQNWSPVFANEFIKRRGYNISPYLPIIAGIPVENANFSENFLYDVRKTIDDLITENFFGTMAAKAKEKDCLFSAESVAPVMISDAMKHYKQVDIPMGEFWFNSPTHDKPTDILDAISAAHIYGKNIIQSEAFTTLRMDWNENPAILKTLGDRNFAQGINRFVFHVFAHNPWMDKKPGMTLNTVGLYFQRDQTWWNHGKAWIEYIQRCQVLLQKGTPIVDIAVFTGEEYPRRALTPDRLIPTLPGLFGEEVLNKEKYRLLNKSVPMVERPYSVINSANTFEPANWIDPLRGYKYDSFNKDALINLASVKDGKIIFPGGQSYSLLVIPASRKGSPNNILSPETTNKLCELIEEGATVIFEKRDTTNLISFGVASSEAYKKLFEIDNNNSSMPQIKTLGKGKILYAPYFNKSFEEIGIEKDLIAIENGQQQNDIAWTHRTDKNSDIYFISNQAEKERIITFSFRVNAKQPELYMPVSGKIIESVNFLCKNNRTEIPLKLAANESVFVVFKKSVKNTFEQKNWIDLKTIKKLDSNWEVKFSKDYAGIKQTIKMPILTDWSKSDNDSIKYFSGVATYTNTFEIEQKDNVDTWLDLGNVKYTAHVFVNGKSCGFVWTYPYRVNISETLVEGKNKIEIEVANTWKNRIIGDNTVFKDNPFTSTTAPFRIAGQPLVESGLLGPVQLMSEE